MNDVSISPSRRFPLRWLLILILAGTVLAGAWFAYRHWSELQARQNAARLSTEGQLRTMGKALEHLRSDQRANARSVQDAAATNRVLRDELLGLGQRNALLEESVARLATSSRQGAQALRQDEVELVLSQAQQRLLYAGDIEGARRLYALAGNLIETLDQPSHLNLRQALMQERAALDVLGPGIRSTTLAQLARLAGALQQLPDQAPALSSQQPAWWQKVLGPLVKIRPADKSLLVARSERIAAADSLQIELSLARAAVERSDTDAFLLALDRIDAWITRLWPDTPARRELRAEVRRLRSVELRPTLPELGSTLHQLRSLREGSAAP